MDRQDGRMAQNIERLSIFELGGKLFGLDILKTREVLPMPSFTPLPNSKEIYFGVFNLRGNIYPLVDVSPILGLPEKNIQPEDMVILVDDNTGFLFGMLVDKIHSVISYNSGDLKPAKGVVSRAMEDFVYGIIQIDRNTIHMIDLTNIFRAKKLLAHY